jgi:hypothetical protein
MRGYGIPRYIKQVSNEAPRQDADPQPPHPFVAACASEHASGNLLKTAFEINALFGAYFDAS